MGESIMEATILKWVKDVGDHVDLDETILEIATDKVDSEIPSPVAGILKEINFQENDVVEIGTVIATIATDSENSEPSPSPAVANKPIEEKTVEHAPSEAAIPTVEQNSIDFKASERFYSPLVKNIAKQENIGLDELDQIPGTGQNNRLTKKDILAYIANKRNSINQVVEKVEQAPQIKSQNVVEESTPKVEISQGSNVEIIEMDRMRRLIADHMVNSKRTSPHVTSYVEVDVTDIVQWRNKVKSQFIQDHGQKITFTPIFIEAIVKALKDFPMVNVSVDGNNIIRKKDINIGMAAALPTGNLIVPVIKNADTLNLVGLTKQVNDFAHRARANQLKPDEIQGGTFTVTNVGTFGNVMGTPIINQPQVAIMAVGAIRKETGSGRNEIRGSHCCQTYDVFVLII